MRVDNIKKVFALAAYVSLVLFVGGCGRGGGGASGLSGTSSLASGAVDTSSTGSNAGDTLSTGFDAGDTSSTGSGAGDTSSTGSGSVESSSVIGIEGENCADLITSQDDPAGSVCTSVEGSNVVVTYTTTDDWLMTDVHLWAGEDMADMPQNYDGSPTLGQFPYSESFDSAVTEYSVEVPLSEYGLDENMVESATVTTYIVAQAGVESQGEGGGQQEDAYGDGGSIGEQGDGPDYFTIILTGDPSDTDSPPAVQTGDPSDTAPPSAADLTCETAYAHDASGTCFIDSDQIVTDRWGWTIGPLAPGDYSFDIYAAAGQCILGNGTMTGVLNVSYDGSTANVSYEMNPDFWLGATHLYVGSDPFPRDSEGNFTVTPGQYGHIHDLEEFAASDSFMIEGLSGDIFIIAHSETCAETWP